MMRRLLADLHVAWRALRRSPGTAMAAIVTLALGTGANTAVRRPRRGRPGQRARPARARRAMRVDPLEVLRSE